MDTNDSFAPPTTISPLRFLTAYDAQAPAEVEIPDHGSYLLLNSAAVPHQRHLPMGCSEACTVQFLPRLTPAMVEELKIAEVPTTIMSRPIAINRGTLIAANARTTWSGLTTTATASLAAWGYANGYGSRIATTDELGVTLRAAREAYASIPGADGTAVERGAVLIAASAMRFGYAPQLFADFCTQCTISNPQDGMAAAFDKLDEMLGREAPCTLQRQRDRAAGRAAGAESIPLELHLFASQYAQPAAVGLMATTTAVPAADVLVGEAAASQATPAMPLGYGPVMQNRLKSATTTTREWMFAQIQSGADMQTVLIGGAAVFFVKSLKAAMDEDRRAGLLPKEFDIEKYAANSSAVADVADGIRMEATQLGAVNAALGTTPTFDSGRRRLDRVQTKAPLFDLSKVPGLEGNEHLDNNPLRALLSLTGPELLIEMLAKAHPRTGQVGLRNEMADVATESVANAGLGLSGDGQHKEAMAMPADSALRKVLETTSPGFGMWNILRPALETMGAPLNHDLQRTKPLTLTTEQHPDHEQGRGVRR